MTTAIHFPDAEFLRVTESIDEITGMIRTAANKGFSQPFLLQLTVDETPPASVWVNLNNVLFFREDEDE